MPEHLFLLGDAQTVLKRLPNHCVHAIITSPPYWGHRRYLSDWVLHGGDPDCQHDFQEVPAAGYRNERQEQRDRKRAHLPGRKNLVTYLCRRCGGWKGELGLEANLQDYVQRLVAIFQECYRVLKPEGTLWLNIGDTYVSRQSSRWTANRKGMGEDARTWFADTCTGSGLPEKSLAGVPWRLALALQDSGWILRADVVWSKPNPMPGLVPDRPLTSHEYLFMFVKQKRYYYNREYSKEPASDGLGERQLRTVWTIPVGTTQGDHPAPFPEELVARCIGLSVPLQDGWVLDPFGGSGTVSVVAEKMGRNSIYIDAERKFLEIAASRVREAGGMFAACVTYEEDP